jgi:small-conductance mechanosensitive channel
MNPFIPVALLFILGTSLYSQEQSVESNLTQEVNQTQVQLAQLALEKKRELEKQKEQNRLLKMAEYRQQLKTIEQEIAEENMWLKSYDSYLSALEVKKNLQAIQKRIDYLNKHAKSESDRDELNGLISKERILASQIEKLKGENSSPFADLITPPKIDEIPKIENPFDIFAGLSLVKKLNANYNEYKKRKENLAELISVLEKESEIYKKLASLEKGDRYAKISKHKEIELDTFKRALDTMEVTLDVYQKRLDVAEVNINKGIKTQIQGVIHIGIIILFVVLVFFLLKLVIKKYITDNERFYMANKIINFTNMTIIVLILFFNYIENAGYLVTILGFASAGIAIAMKDWFMSILGWLVIVFGGSIHVGDRIRVDMGGMRYVGDVLDISLLRITILEDITLTSIMHNRRAGRIIFVPNNYIFTHMIANYTHNSLKTVWDGIKITITYDSNHKKAMHLVKEITKKYSKGYTDITRKQLNKLRHNYSLKNTNVEPRIYSFIEPYGIDIEAWYLTNAYATLTLRSTISTEILDAFNKEEDITIAYPTQKLHLSTRELETGAHKHEMV